MSWFRPNADGIRDYARSREVSEGLLQTAEAATQEARKLAPVDTGDYRDSIHAESGQGVARVASDDPKALYLEFGTVDTPTFQTLRRSVEAVGVKLVKK